MVYILPLSCYKNNEQLFNKSCQEQQKISRIGSCFRGSRGILQILFSYIYIFHTAPGTVICLSAHFLVCTDTNIISASLFQTGKCSGQCTGGHCSGPSHGPWGRILDLIAGCLYIFLPACGKGSVCFFQSCQQSFWRQDFKGKRFVDKTVFSDSSDLHSSNSGIFIILVIQLISTRTDLLSIYSYGYRWPDGFSRISVRGSV